MLLGPTSQKASAHKQVTRDAAPLHLADNVLQLQEGLWKRVQLQEGRVKYSSVDTHYSGSQATIGETDECEF